MENKSPSVTILIAFAKLTYASEQELMGQVLEISEAIDCDVTESFTNFKKIGMFACK